MVSPVTTEKTGGRSTTRETVVDTDTTNVVSTINLEKMVYWTSGKALACFGLIDPQPKESFISMVQNEDDRRVKCQVAALVGGAICNSHVDFGNKLMGSKYNGLYILDGVMSEDSQTIIPSVERLKDMRESARHKAQEKRGPGFGRSCW